MKLALSLMVLCATLSGAARGAPDPNEPIINPAIDDEAFLRVVSDALRHRADRRLSEAEFIRMARQSGTVVLDARSKEKFDQLHIDGAVNLSFPDIALASLESVLPDKSVRILIYCNNNFSGAEGPFPSKLPSASLNLPTYVALYDYGYRNVFELGPLIDIEATAIVFATSPPPTP
jgi:hypothetical protein